MKKLFFDMDGVLVDFQSGIDKLSDDTKQEYEGKVVNIKGLRKIKKNEVLPNKGKKDKVFSIFLVYFCSVGLFGYTE